MKKLILILVTLVSVATASANENPKTMEATVVNAQTIKITSNIEVKANETYEIQKSYDNKSFSTIAVLMGTEDVVNMPAFSMNDKVSKTTKVYYRIVKVENDQFVTISSLKL